MQHKNILLGQSKRVTCDKKKKRFEHNMYRVTVDGKKHNNVTGAAPAEQVDRG